MGRPKGSKNKKVETAVAEEPKARRVARTKAAPEVAQEPTPAPIVESPFEDPDETDGLSADGTPTEPEDDPVPPVGENTAIDRMAASIEKFVQVQTDTAPRKNVPWSRYKPKSVYNPTGNKRRTLTRRCYQNGHRLFVPNLHDEEISLLNQIEEGVYIHGMVRVAEVMDGKNTNLHIIYKAGGQKDYMENQSEWRNLTELLKRCVTEGPTSEDELRKTERRRIRG